LILLGGLVLKGSELKVGFPENREEVFSGNPKDEPLFSGKNNGAEGVEGAYGAEGTGDENEYAGDIADGVLGNAVENLVGCANENGVDVANDDVGTVGGGRNC
jgi:hypothetical protein